MNKKRTRRKFSKEFKEEAVRLCEQKPVKEVGEAPELLYRWRQSLASEGVDAFRGNGNRTALEQENWELKRKIAELEEEKEILKKASAYFAKHPPNNHVPPSFLIFIT